MAVVSLVEMPRPGGQEPPRGRAEFHAVLAWWPHGGVAAQAGERSGAKTSRESMETPLAPSTIYL